MKNHYGYLEGLEVGDIITGNECAYCGHIHGWKCMEEVQPEHTVYMCGCMDYMPINYVLSENRTLNEIDNLVFEGIIKPDLKIFNKFNSNKEFPVPKIYYFSNDIKSSKTVKTTDFDYFILNGDIITIYKYGNKKDIAIEDFITVF